MLLPALSLIRGDRASDELAPETESFICRSTHDILDYLTASRQRDAAADEEVLPEEGGSLPPEASCCSVARHATKWTNSHCTCWSRCWSLRLVDSRCSPAGPAPAAVAVRVHANEPAVLCASPPRLPEVLQMLYLCKRLSAPGSQA